MAFNMHDREILRRKEKRRLRANITEKFGIPREKNGTLA